MSGIVSRAERGLLSARGLSAKLCGKRDGARKRKMTCEEMMKIAGSQG